MKLLNAVTLVLACCCAMATRLPGALADRLALNEGSAEGGSRSLEDLIALLPKAELHVHLEGTLEPEMMLAFGRRNNISLPYANAQAARAARVNYTSLEDFLHEYELGIKVLQTEQDFYELADAYFAKAQEQNIRHVELFFDAQAHTSRGVPWNEFFTGLKRAVVEAPARHGVHAALILCFVRDQGPEAAAEALAQAEPYLDSVLGVGLDSAELGWPPVLFKGVYKHARALGLHRVAHAGEEGGPELVWQAIRKLKVQRVDHGIHATEDPELVEYMEEHQLPITLCPISNLLLQVYAGSLEAKLREVLSTSILVTLNSDDPAYMGSYINANYAYMRRVAGLDSKGLAALADASFRASFLPGPLRQAFRAEVARVLQDWEADIGSSD